MSSCSLFKVETFTSLWGNYGGILQVSLRLRRTFRLRFSRVRRRTGFLFASFSAIFPKTRLICLTDVARWIFDIPRFDVALSRSTTLLGNCSRLRNIDRVETISHPKCLPGFSVPVQSKVRCSEQWMEVDIVRSSPQARIYLQQMKDFPGKDRFEACFWLLPAVRRRSREI